MRFITNKFQTLKQLKKRKSTRKGVIAAVALDIVRKKAEAVGPKVGLGEENSQLIRNLL